MFSDTKQAVSQKPCLVFPSCFKLLGICFHHRLCLLHLTNMTHLVGKSKNIQWWIIHIWLSELLESFTSPYLVCMCLTCVFLPAMEPIACVFPLRKTSHSPSPLPLQQFLHMGEVILFQSGLCPAVLSCRFPVHRCVRAFWTTGLAH